MSNEVRASLRSGIVVCPLHAYYRSEHLTGVVQLMRRLGPPTLRGYWDPETGAWFMREGCHRLRAAHALGLTPSLVSIPWWRQRHALTRARFAAMEYGLTFPDVKVLGVG